MAENINTSKFLGEYEKQKGFFFDRNAQQSQTSGEEAKSIVENRVKVFSKTLGDLRCVEPNNPLCTTIDGNDFITIQYGDGTVSTQFRDKKSNLTQITIWGNKGPEGISMQAYSMDTANTAVEHTVILTDTNKVVGKAMRYNEVVATYEIDLRQ